MEIQKEDKQKHSIQSYQEHVIQIAEKSYTGSILLTPQEIISPWVDFADLSLARVQTIDLSEVELIILGIEYHQFSLPFDIRSYLASRQIGLEQMRLGAGCRTFNVLLAENRQVMGWFFLK